MITLTSATLLVAILLWAVYHVPILFVGIRRRFGDIDRKNVKVIRRLPKFSLIVPAKDEEAVISRCLEALLSLDYPRGKIEIIIVDGDSRDATLEICLRFSRKHPSIIKVLRQGPLRGKPAALNQALPHTTGEIVGVYDADSVPERDALRKVTSYFRDPSVVAVQGRPCPLNEGRNMLTKVAAKERRAWFQALLQGRERLGLFIPLTGSCQFIRRRVLEEIGGWEEDSLAEDVELALGLLERGYLVRYAHDVCSREETPTSMRSLVKQRTRWYRGYMEAAFRYGRLLKRPSRKNVDAEVSLMGPYIMTLCLASYLNWILSLIVASQTVSPLLSPITLAVMLTALTLFSIGIALTFMDRPARLRNLLWIPFIYLYWFMQTVIAGWAFLQILLRRPRIWEKTVKSGSTTTDLVGKPS